MKNLAAAFLGCGFMLLSACGVPNSADSGGGEPANELAVGAKARTRAPVAIATRWAEDYNYKTREDILALRKKYVNEMPILFDGQYEPSTPVFSAIEDRKPWWGLAGRSVWGAGQRSIEGLSEESRFVSNPYLLVGGDPASANVWKKSAITKEDLENPNFPYAWHLKSLTWWPDRSVGQAVYAVSEFNEHMYAFRDKLKVQLITPAFNLVAYNARDFGYNYIWLDEKHSTNIVNVNQPKPEAVRITQMFHCGGTCGFVGGCNNMSPMIPAIDRIKYTKLPAKAAIRLWHEKPATVEQAPDMTFYVDLE